MENLNFNNIFNREQIATSIKTVLKHFESNKTNLSFKRGIYIYGAPGSGKTEFVTKLLKELDYDVIKYDAGDIRNKSIIDTITKHNMADKNIISLFHKKTKYIAIVMDEIDGMNNGDKGGINSLIKLIRPKKTKKQKTEEISFNPIICISNYHMDKKIKELMKICNVFELKCPTTPQIQYIIKESMPTLEQALLPNIINYLQGDLRKLLSIYNIYKNHCSILKNEIIQNIFKPKSYNEDTKEITNKLINQKFSISDHLTTMNETDRTIVGLLWHENIIDAISKVPKETSVPFYLNILDNLCFADYMDRITFQKQIWQFNEMSSLIKTFHCNKIYHDTFKKKPKINASDIRFTKVLTKYSTEYNNSLFIKELCQQLGLDKKDMFSFFLELRMNHPDEEIYGMFESYDICKLDINRIYRYLDKYTNKDCSIGDEPTTTIEDFLIDESVNVDI
jgi:DNA polymerase III delta prime subunit